MSRASSLQLFLLLLLQPSALLKTFKNQNLSFALIHKSRADFNKILTTLRSRRQCKGLLGGAVQFSTSTIYRALTAEVAIFLLTGENQESVVVEDARLWSLLCFLFPEQLFLHL